MTLNALYNCKYKCLLTSGIVTTHFINGIQRKLVL